MRERLLQIIFFLSLPWALAWTLGLVFEDFFKGYLPTQSSYSIESIRLMPMVVLHGLSFFVLVAVSKINPGFLLIPPAIKPAKIVLFLALTVIGSYLGAAILTFFIANAVVTVDPRALNEKGIVVFVLSVLLPLWWMLPLAMVATGMLLNRRREKPA